jgi:hypothetical protein
VRIVTDEVYPMTGIKNGLAGKMNENLCSKIQFSLHTTPKSLV